MGRVRQARREGVTTLNQRVKASQAKTTSSNLTDLGWVAARTHMSGELPRLVNVAGREATLKVCGVGVAMLQGHSWAPHPTNGRLSRGSWKLRWGPPPGAGLMARSG